MDELHQTARAYYKAAPENVKQLANEFFEAMDLDKDRRVSLHEFLAFMRQVGYSQMKNSQFFKELNKDGTGSLNFWEVMTLYYIVKSGRPFCEGCSEFIKGMFFTCVQCYEHGGGSISICPDCFKAGTYVHEHQQFLDNFVLLETKRNKYNKMQTSESSALTPLSSSTCNAIVPGNRKPKKGKGRAAFKALEVAISLGNIASNMCSIM